MREVSFPSLNEVKSFRNALNSERGVFGPFMITGDPALVECAGYAGYDFVLLDMAVSYTHLDVYKRQVCQSGLRYPPHRRARHALYHSQGNVCLCRGEEAVSYTHLNFFLRGIGEHFLGCGKGHLGIVEGDDVVHGIDKADVDNPLRGAQSGHKIRS